MPVDGDAAVVLDLAAAVRRGEPVVLATVVETDRSVPRRPGSKMLVYPDGRTSGTIGGGAMEARVVADAVAALDDARPRLVRFDLVDPDRGDPGVCGGSVQLYLEPYLSRPTVFVVGCGHIGRAVVELAHWLGFRLVATDDRAELVTAEHLPHADVLLPGPLDDALRAHPITDQTHVVVVTRSMAVDVANVPKLLATPARSIGVMGSRRRWHETVRELRDRGVAEDALARVTSPIGIELGAETPREIAVSILAEIVAQRRGAPEA
jgi:xanthine dehydrogenase accessory factor